MIQTLADRTMSAQVKPIVCNYKQKQMLSFEQAWMLGTKVTN